MIARKLVSFKSDINENMVQGYLITAIKPNFNFNCPFEIHSIITYTYTIYAKINLEISCTIVKIQMYKGKMN